MELCRRANRISLQCHALKKEMFRICGWLKDGGIIGRLTDNMEENLS